MKTLFIQYFRYIHFENGGWTGTEHYTCMIHDNQNNKTKFDSLFPKKFANFAVTKNLLRSACFGRLYLRNQ